MTTPEIQNVCVVGAGTMGEGIVQIFAQGGLKVNVVDQDKTILERCFEQVRANLVQFEKAGLLSENPATVLSRIRLFSSDKLSEAVTGCQFVLETIIESLEAKREIFAQLDWLPPAVTLASNTSSLTVSLLTEKMKTPSRVVGLHFFNPAHIIPLVEIHKSDNTAQSALEITRGLMTRVGKKPVLVRKEVPGFIINRLTGAMEREIDYLLDEGIVTAEDLDEAVKASFGFRLACLGPQEAEDMIGLDVSARVSERVFKSLSNRTEPSSILLEKVSKGELGIKAGKGWYDYSGKPRQQVIAENNRLLLEQLALYRSRRPNAGKQP
jgi:3-hydroxybutyryl-CoA dehydrogenase